ncbi:MAG: hypothetical protein KDA93_11875 [Planctomycetaceae bacterium]|nr:hypothetical protein [Planctomycetaceae bacterium]
MSQPRRFVILTHDHPFLHWDFMLESGDVLRTWRLEREPQSGVDFRATELPDHRRMYLDYEGPVSGDRGTVRRWDAGTYSISGESSNELTIDIAGEHTCGTITLRKTDVADEWTFVLREPTSDGRWSR